MLLTVHVKTRAPETKIVKWLDGNTVKVAVTEAPERGRANQQVITLLAQELKIAPSQLTIRRGANIPIKQIEIN